MLIENISNQVQPVINFMGVEILLLGRESVSEKLRKEGKDETSK